MDEYGGMTTAEAMEHMTVGAAVLRDCGYGMTAEQYVREEMMNDLVGVLEMITEVPASGGKRPAS